MKQKLIFHLRIVRQRDDTAAQIHVPINISAGVGLVDSATIGDRIVKVFATKLHMHNIVPIRCVGKYSSVAMNSMLKAALQPNCAASTAIGINMLSPPSLLLSTMRRTQAAIAQSPKVTLIALLEPNLTRMQPLRQQAVADDTDDTIVFMKTLPGMYFK